MKQPQLPDMLLVCLEGFSTSSDACNSSSPYSWVQVDKARSWLLRAVQLARGDNGDFWALLYKLESQYGNADSQKKVCPLSLLFPGLRSKRVLDAATLHSPCCMHEFLS